MTEHDLHAQVSETDSLRNQFIKGLVNWTMKDLITDNSPGLNDIKQLLDLTHQAHSILLTSKKVFNILLGRSNVGRHCPH